MKATTLSCAFAGFLFFATTACSSDSGNQQNTQETDPGLDDVMPQESTQPQEIEPDTMQMDTTRTDSRGPLNSN